MIVTIFSDSCGRWLPACSVFARMIMHNFCKKVIQCKSLQPFSYNLSIGLLGEQSFTFSPVLNKISCSVLIFACYFVFIDHSSNYENKVHNVFGYRYIESLIDRHAGVCCDCDF